MNSVPPGVLVKWLRAAGEPSRLRLLALCAESALSVSDLAQTLRQSEPRVSRHLKILSDAGLTERLRQGQWVHYRVSCDPDTASFVRGLLAQLDRRDPLLLGDRANARSAAGSAAQGAASESRLGRTLAEFLTAGEPAPLGPALIVGVDHPELLERAARASPRCTAIAHSRRAAQGARAYAERRGFTCRIVQSLGPRALSEAGLARAGEGFDAVLLDHPAAAGATLAQLLRAARGVLTPGGRLWIFEPYDSLESSRGRIVEHPLARLRRVLGEAGFACERISPVEADGKHVLAAAARLTAAQQHAQPGRAQP
jgi:ArsR family transcriptional regulator